MPLSLFFPRVDSIQTTHMAPCTPDRKKRKSAPRKSTPDIELIPPSSSPIAPDAEIDTPHRVRLQTLNKQFAGKVSKRAIFKAANLSNHERQGYRILKEGPRRSERLHNRGRKRQLNDAECHAIEVVEDSSFAWGRKRHAVVADYLGLKGDTSERTIQRSMANHGVGTYVAAQAKFLSDANIAERMEYCAARRDWPLEKWKQFRYCDESHHGIGSARRARVHRRRGRKNRYAANKIQYRRRREPKVLHTFAVIGWDYKGELYFYEGSGKNGALTQDDYMQILEFVVLPDWDPEMTLLEDNDGPHGTRGIKDNKVKRLKKHLGINWQANPANSPDLNPIEKCWRILKQRDKNWPTYDAEILKAKLETI